LYRKQAELLKIKCTRIRTGKSGRILFRPGKAKPCRGHQKESEYPSFHRRAM
jgi:hypothetical protein